MLTIVRLGAGALAMAAATLAALPVSAQQSNIPVGMAVSVTKAARTCFTDTLQVAGILMPREEVFVRPEQEGLQVSSITVEDGDRVTSGQVLARLTRHGGHGAAATAP